MPTVPEQAAAPPQPDAAALTIVAEIALQRGDCRTAAETYARAAPMARRRWHTARREVGAGLRGAAGCVGSPPALAEARDPQSRDAQAMYAAVALKLYRIADARDAVKAFISAPPPPRRHGAAARTARVPRRRPATDGGVADLSALLLEESDPPRCSRR